MCTSSGQAANLFAVFEPVQGRGQYYQCSGYLRRHGESVCSYIKASWH